VTKIDEVDEDNSRVMDWEIKTTEWSRVE